MTAALRHPLPESQAIQPVEPAAGLPAPRTDSPAAGTSCLSAEIELAKIERALATMPSLGQQVTHLNIQIERFEDLGTDIERWLDRHAPGHWKSNPFAPWSNDSALFVRLRLGAMHAALVDKIKAAKAEAIEALE